MARTALWIWKGLKSGDAGKTGTTALTSTREKGDAGRPRAQNGAIDRIPLEIERADESPAVLCLEEAAEGE
jgi:hypothetical protein